MPPNSPESEKHPYPIQQGRRKDILDAMSLSRLRIEADRMAKEIEGLKQNLLRHEKPFFVKADKHDKLVTNSIHYLTNFINEGLWYVENAFPDQLDLKRKVDKIRKQLVEMCDHLRTLKQTDKTQENEQDQGHNKHDQGSKEKV